MNTELVIILVAAAMLAVLPGVLLALCGWVRSPSGPLQTDWPQPAVRPVSAPKSEPRRTQANPGERRRWSLRRLGGPTLPEPEATRSANRHDLVRSFRRNDLLPVSLSLLFFLSVTALCAADWPGDWPAGAPDAEGFNSAKLETFWTGLKARGTTALLLIRNDKIIFERYAEGFSRSKPHFTASMAKALVGGVSFMLALDEGRVQPDQPACRFVPQWTNDTTKARITIRELATHTSGIEDAEEGDIPHKALTGWKGDFWKQLPPPRDPFTLARDIAPVLDPPGTRERYSNPGMAMVSYCLTASLRGSTNGDLRAWLRNRVMDPIGVPAAEWSVGYGGPSKVDDLSLTATWGGGNYSPNATARVGRLLLHGGNWNGRQLLSRQAVEQATTWAELPGHSGLGWWVNRNADGTRFWPCLPIDAFYGAGAGHQFLLVVPSLDLLVVRNGDVLERGVDFDKALGEHLVVPLMACFEKKQTRAER